MSNKNNLRSSSTAKQRDKSVGFHTNNEVKYNTNSNSKMNLKLKEKSKDNKNQTEREVITYNKSILNL